MDREEMKEILEEEYVKHEDLPDYIVEAIAVETQHSFLMNMIEQGHLAWVEGGGE